MTINELLGRLRKGEEVTCTLCNSGILKPAENTDYENTHCFVCSHCGEMLNID